MSVTSGNPVDRPQSGLDGMEWFWTGAQEMLAYAAATRCGCERTAGVAGRSVAASHDVACESLP